MTFRRFAAQPALTLDLVGIALENCTALRWPCRDVNEFFPYYWGDNESKDDLQRVRIPLLLWTWITRLAQHARSASGWPGGTSRGPGLRARHPGEHTMTVSILRTHDAYVQSLEDIAMSGRWVLQARTADVAMRKADSGANMPLCPNTSGYSVPPETVW